MIDLNISKIDFENFSEKYKEQVKEILVLTSSLSGGGSKFYESCLCCEYFLAYIDLETNDLKEGKGRICWLISQEQSQKKGIAYPFYLKQETIYRIKVRELIDKTVPEGYLASAYNNFMIVEVIEENAQNDILSRILRDYLKPVVINDNQLGRFTLNKELQFFEGKIKWLNTDILVYLNVDLEDEKSWSDVLDILRDISTNQEQYDSDYRSFAAEKLIDLANDWLDEEEEDSIITADDFIHRINLSELSVDADGSFSAYYNDDDIFAGHSIAVSGNINTGLESANIEG